MLFADVVHSMDIARQVGPERLREIMARLVDRASAVVQRYGGTVDKFTGDGIMAVFGAPLALEDHAVRACLAALGIQEAIEDFDLQLRIGLNSGQVIAGELGSGAMGYTAIGEHVGMAQRMESVAPPGAVMLSASTARLVDGVATLGEPESVQIKGADEPVPARRLLGIRQDRAVGRLESKLVGRRWEMSALEALLDRAIEGQGAVVSISGSAGIGKSRLTRELAAMAASRGVQVFATFCESHTSQVPFHVVKRLFRAATGVEGLDAANARAVLAAQPRDADPEDLALFEDLLGVANPDVPLPQIDPDARRRRLTAMVNAASLAVQSPAVYVIEDAHWIDDASESLLAGFLTVVPQTPLLTIITARPEYHGALAQVPGAQTFALAPLSDSETSALVSDLLGTDPSVSSLGDTIAERAGGTPFFAEELVLELAERDVLQGKPGSYVSEADAAEVSVPATLQATIASRIDRLDPKAKNTLSAAAVIGSRFGADLLATLGVEPAFDDLLAAQLIDQVTFTHHPEYVFRQPLIRTVAYESQLKSDRTDMHRRLAAAIETGSAGVGDANAALIAEHLEAAGDLPAAFDWHMRAATWSNNRDIAAARGSWGRACRVADALPADQPGRLAMRIAPRTVLCATDWRVHADKSGDRFEELRELCGLAGDKTSLAVGMTSRLGWHAQRGEAQEAQQLAAELMTVLHSIRDPDLSAQVGYSAVATRATAGDMNEVLRWTQATIDWASGDLTKGNLIVGSPLAVAHGLRGLARSWFGRNGWRQDFDDALLIAEQTGEPLTLAMVISWTFGMGMWNRVLSADDATVHLVEGALRTVEAAGDDYAVVMVRDLLACALLVRGADGDQKRGLELLGVCRELAVEQQYLGSELSLIEVYFARERAEAGDVDGAIPLLRKAVDDMTACGQVGYYIPAYGVLVDALLARGNESDLAEAERAIIRLQAVPAEGSVMRDIWVLRMQTLITHARGDDTRYRELRDRYREMATSLGFEGHMQWAAAMP